MLQPHKIYNHQRTAAPRQKQQLTGGDSAAEAQSICRPVLVASATQQCIKSSTEDICTDLSTVKNDFLFNIACCTSLPLHQLARFGRVSILGSHGHSRHSAQTAEVVEERLLLRVDVHVALWLRRGRMLLSCWAKGLLVHAAVAGGPLLAHRLWL